MNRTGSMSVGLVVAMVALVLVYQKLVVSDSGGDSGLKEAVTALDSEVEGERERAFERFYQASSAKEGIGLGLNISRMIIERFGGEIAIHSEGKGRGTSVVTKLPLSLPDTITYISSGRPGL